MDFDYSISLPSICTPVTMGAVAAIHEYKGKQELYQALKPESFEKLAAVARVQSIGSSNKIEGIETTDARLEALAAGKVAPRNRDEREIAGYRYVLDLIHERYAHIAVTPNVILQLHRDLFDMERASFAGRWKDSDNAIVERLPGGRLRTRFEPTSAAATPDAVESLCRTYNESIEQGVFSPLLCVAQFVFDFVSIHPFVDGNGRMSRLLMLLLLYQNGYLVGKYISLEAKIAKNKDLYYEVLGKAQNGWHEGEEDVVPFIKYLLGTILAAYKDFEDRFEIIGEKLPALEMVRKATKNKIGKFSKQDIRELCPSLSISSIEGSLRTLVKEGELMRGGSGKATYYVRLM